MGRRRGGTYGVAKRDDNDSPRVESGQGAGFTIEMTFMFTAADKRD